MNIVHEPSLEDIIRMTNGAIETHTENIVLHHDKKQPKDKAIQTVDQAIVDSILAEMAVAVENGDDAEVMVLDSLGYIHEENGVD